MYGYDSCIGILLINLHKLHVVKLEHVLMHTYGVNHTVVFVWDYLKCVADRSCYLGRIAATSLVECKLFWKRIMFKCYQLLILFIFCQKCCYIYNCCQRMGLLFIIGGSLTHNGIGCKNMKYVCLSGAICNIQPIWCVTRCRRTIDG